jgi:hypothetical protein
MLFDITTHGITGLIGSDTSACSGKLSIGMRRPAIPISTDVCPAATTPIFFYLIVPRVVSTPSTAPCTSR